MDADTTFIDISNSFIDISNSFIDISNSFIDISNSFIDTRYHPYSAPYWKCLVGYNYPRGHPTRPSNPNGKRWSIYWYQ